MSYKTSTQGTYFSQFTNDEKIAYALNLSLAKVTTDAFKAGYEWYNSPDLFNAISKQSILSDSIPKYNEINNYYCIITVNGKEYITNKTVDNILTYQGGFKLSQILGTNSEILNGTSNENSNPPTSSDFNSSGLCTKLPRQAFAYFVYWKNKLTGLGGTGNNANGTSGGLWPHSDDSLSLKLTLNSDGSNNADRIYSNVIANEDLMTKLQDYIPLKIINPSFISGTIDQTNGIPENLKQYVNKKIAINVGVPTISTWNGLSNSNNSDNIAFFNPLLTKSLNEPYGYNGMGLGNGYWIRGTDSSRTNIRPDYGSSAVGEGTMIFSAMTGFILFFGVSNILTNSTGVSVKNPPCVTALRYTGETFSDGIISQGDTLPAVEVSNDKDLFINTTDNTIHRLTINEFGDKEWIGIGGSGGSGGSGSSTGTFVPGGDMEINGVLKIKNDSTNPENSFSIVNANNEYRFLTTLVGGSSNLYMYDAAGNIPISLISDWHSYFNVTGGNVGIGTDFSDMKAGDNGAKLTIGDYDNNNSKVSGKVYDTLRLSVKTDKSTSYHGLHWYNTNHNFTMSAIRSSVGANWNNSSLHFYTSKDRATPTEKMSIDSDGNVNISSGNLTVSGTVTANGELLTGGGGGGGGGGSTVTVTKKGQTLETLVGVFDGRTVEVESGTYTLKNVTDIIDADNRDWFDLPNTDIDYKPPAGTKQVYIRYTVAIDDAGYRKRPSWRLAIDGEIYEEQAIIEQLDNNDENWASETKNRSFVLHINGTNDIANGFLESWDTLKKIQLQVASSGGRQFIHRTRTFSNGTTGLRLLKPSIKLVAIGESTTTSGGGSGGGSTITKEGQVLEMLSGMCDGRSIIGNSGTYTLQSVTAPLYLTSTYQDVTGSEISYKPPEGTRYVIYSFKYYLTFDANSLAYANSGIKLLIDDIVQVEPEMIGIRRHSDEYVYVNFTIEINGETNSENITLNEWTTHKTLKLQARERTSTRQGILHMGNVYTEEIGGGGDVQTVNGEHIGGTIKKPTLSITAIGQSTITTGGGGDSEITIGTNMVTTYFSTPQEVTIPNTLPGYHVSELDLIITPKYNDSIIEIKFNLFGEMDENSCFRIKRNDDFVITTTSNKENAISIPSYDQNYTTTPQMTQVRWYDTPNTTGSITYKLYVSRASATTTYTYFINRSGETQHPHSEFGISTACAIEHPTPRTITVGGGGGSTSTGGSGTLLFAPSSSSSPWNTSADSISYNTSNNTFAIKDYDDPNITFSKTDYPNPNGIGLYLAGSSGHLLNLKIPHIYTSFPDYSGLSRLNFTCQSDFIWYNHANVNHDNNSGAHTEVMRVKNNGRVGIGTNNPQAGLHVATTVSTYNNSGITDDSVFFLNDWGSVSNQANAAFDFNSSNNANHIVSIIGKGLIYGQSYVGASDQRIKKNIFEVDDDKALQKLRDISCCWYNYIDHLKRGKQRTIGFIAQQVKEQLPEAVQTLQDFIPNKMKSITDASWNDTTMLSNELLDVSGIKYKFYVSNDLSGNEKEIDLIGQNDNSFVFDQSYNHVFCYGKEVDDFYTLDKQKLFALNFSATQEIDRIQQKQLLDISGNKVDIELLKLENAELKQQNQTLIERLEAIEKRLQDANI